VLSGKDVKVQLDLESLSLPLAESGACR
jgi:hypothetical protein